MSRVRFSLRSIFIWTAVIGVALVCLIRPSFPRTVLFFSGTLAALAAALVGAACSKGASRAFWLGFAICGGGHFVLALAPWWQQDVSPLLLSSQLLELFGGLVGFDLSQGPFVTSTVWDNIHAASWYNDPADDFLVIGHCEFSLLVGWLGGMLGGFFHRLHNAPCNAENAA